MGGTRVLIIDGNAVYEVDINCINQKQQNLAKLGKICCSDEDLINIESDIIQNQKKVVRKERYTGKGVGVAVLDTGIYLHEDFGNRIIGFEDIIHKKKEPYDSNGHGTQVAYPIIKFGFH